MFSLCTESNYSIYLYNCIMPRYIELHTGTHKTVWCHTVLNYIQGYIQLYAIIYWTTYWGYIPLRFYPSGLLAHKHILGDSNLFGISPNFFLHLQSLTLVLEYLLGPIVNRYTLFKIHLTILRMKSSLNSNWKKNIDMNKPVTPKQMQT